MGMFALFTCYPLACPWIVTFSECPSLVSHCIKFSSGEEVTLKSAYSVSLYYTEGKKKRLHIFELWDVYTMSHVTAQNSFLSRSVWIS